MTDAFNDIPQQNTSLDQVRELPVAFERVLESQKSFNQAESEQRLRIVQQDLDATKRVIDEYQRTLAEKVIETGSIDPMDQSRGLILMTRLNELLVERDSLVESIKCATELQTAMGHLAVASAMITSLDKRLEASIPAEEVPEKPNIIGHFDVPVDKGIKPTASIVVEVPPPIKQPTKVIKTVSSTKYVPRFAPIPLPEEVGKGFVQPLTTTKTK